MKSFVISALLMSALSGCASVKSAMNDSYTSYRAEMFFAIGTRSYRGLALAPPAASTTVTLTSPIPLDRLEISSCGRHEVYREVDKRSGWFGKTSSGYEMAYTYKPTEQEATGMCPLMFQAFSKEAQKAWGMLFFKSDQGLSSVMYCNGVKWEFSGLSVCQTKAGLEQMLKFEVPVKYEASPECSIATTDNKTFMVRSRNEFCKASFSDGHLFQDMVLLGYKQVVIY